LEKELASLKEDYVDLGASCVNEKDSKDEKKITPVGQAFTNVSVNRGSAQISGTIRTIMCADGFWTTSTASAMSTTMTMLPLGDSMWSSIVKLFDEVRFKKVTVTFDFTEYESLLERSAASALARSFVVGLSHTDFTNRDFYYLQDRPGAKFMSPSASRRVFKMGMATPILSTAAGVPHALGKSGWISTSYLNGLSTSDVVCGWAHFASSDTCGIAGVIRVRVQFHCEFRGRRGAA
jgi:hypothetical protein